MKRQEDKNQEMVMGYVDYISKVTMTLKRTVIKAIISLKSFMMLSYQNSAVESRKDFICYTSEKAKHTQETFYDIRIFIKY